MENKQKFFELQISNAGESYLLTKQTRSPFVKSDVFAMGEYKRSMITLLGEKNTVLHSGKIFFDCELSSETQSIISPSPYALEKSHLDFTPKQIAPPTFMQKVKSFFKRETLPLEIFPSNSFICLQNGEEYHFIGALTEKTHTVSFDIVPEKNQVVGKINTQNWACNEDSLLFDIIEIEGSADFIMKTYYHLVEELYKKSPKSSPQLDCVSISLADCENAETLAVLDSDQDYLLAFINAEINDFSVSNYIQKSETAIRKFLSTSKDNVIPIAVISPFICIKTSVEYNLFEPDLVKSGKNKPLSFVVNGELVYILDVFSKSVRGYLQRQVDILLGMGYCGVMFDHLDLLANAIKSGKAQGETLTLAYEFLTSLTQDKLTFCRGGYPAIARGVFDYNIAGNAVESKIKTDDTTAVSTAIDWDFTGFETLVDGNSSNTLFPNMLPIAVDSALLEFDPLLFDLCTVCNTLLCKSFNLTSPTAQSFYRASQFDFLKDAEILEVISIENGRFAIVFVQEDITTVCFFNFTAIDWEMEEITIPAFSYNFQE